MEVVVLDRYVENGVIHAYDHTPHCGLSYQKEVLDPYGKSLVKNHTSGVVIDLGCGKGEASDYLEEKFGFSMVRADISQLALTLGPGDRIR